MFLHNDSIVFPKMAQQTFDWGRVYTMQEGPDKGKAYPSITTVLKHKEKPYLKEWIARVGEAEAEHARDKAGKRGDTLHACAEAYLKNEPVPKPWPHIQELWGRLRPWIDANVRMVYCQETNVCSPKLGVAGRLDLLCDIGSPDDEPVLCIGDFKNALKEKKEDWIQDYYLQGTFYALCVYEHTGRVVKEIVFPVASPGQLQIFKTKPMKHLNALMERIDAYYADHEKIVLDIETPSVV